jgi:hypothetical protein
VPGAAIAWSMTLAVEVAEAQTMERADVRPITFSCEETLRMPPGEIAGQILDLSRWPDFQGYGVLPGIKVAEFETRTPEVVGSRIRVTSTDGSRHTEEIVEWEPDRRLRLRMGEFSAPLSRLASGFDETWEFEPNGEATKVLRSFELHARSGITRPFLWLISVLLRKAIARNLHQMREGIARRGHDGTGSRPEPDRLP